MKARVYIVVCCIIVCSLFIPALWLISKEQFDDVPIIEGEAWDEFIICRTEQNPREDITSFVVDNGKIYVFYDKVALINVYRVDGSFEYGIQIATSTKGRGDIAAKEGRLIIKSRLPIIFIFQDAQLIESISSLDDYEAYKAAKENFTEEKKTNDGGCNYRLAESGDAIIREETQENVCSFPPKNLVAEKLLTMGAITSGLACLVYKKIFEDQVS